MNIPFTDKQMPCLGKVILWVAVAVGMFFVCLLGYDMRGEMSQTAVLGIMAVILAFIVLWGKQLNKNHTEEKALYAARNKALNSIASKYNVEVQQLKDSYNREKEGNSNKEMLRRSYEQRYNANMMSYSKERDTFLRSWDKANATPLRNFWQWAIVIGFISILFSCSFSFGLDMTEDNLTATALMDSRSWSADNVPMPHMQDHSRYLSNPDSIISPQVEDSINATLGRLDDILGVESAMIIVGHIEGDDPTAMVRGIYEKYKVGRNNRGLVVVVGYLDHSYFIAPGRNLEGDLTDLECNHLAQDYLIPSMRAEQPDSGMLYLARGIYSLLARKEMPVMSSLSMGQSADDDDFSMWYMFVYILVLIGWGIFGTKMASRVGWSTTAGIMALMANPFMAPSSAAGFSGGGRSRSWGGGWSGGGHSGGYGGGSWGGGGSGGRW